MAFNNATWEAVERAIELFNEKLNNAMETFQEALGEEADDPLPLDPDDDPRFAAMRQERKECLRTYGYNFTSDYEENGAEGESPEEFLQRREDRYEYYHEWLDSDDPDEVGLDEFEEWKKNDDYGLTEDDMNDDDNW